MQQSGTAWRSHWLRSVVKISKDFTTLEKDVSTTHVHSLWKQELKLNKTERNDYQPHKQHVYTVSLHPGSILQLFTQRS